MAKEKIGKQDKGNRYPEEQKLQVLEIYRSRNFNALQTEKETGIPRVTIRKWAKLFSVNDQRKKELDIIRKNIAKEVALADVDYISKASGIRMKVLEKLEIAVQGTKDVYKLVAIGKLVNEMLSDQGVSSKNTVNVFQHINETLIQNNETKT